MLKLIFWLDPAKVEMHSNTLNVNTVVTASGYRHAYSNCSVFVFMKQSYC